MARNYLEVEPKPSSFMGLVDDLDLEIDDPPPDFKVIEPKPGFCVKVKTSENEKIFINFCHCADVPPPPQSLDVHDIIAANPENPRSRFPISLGELHVELDKKGKRCKCYDVVINSEFYREICEKSTTRDFVMTLACSGLERKYNCTLDVGTMIILNKPYHGKMQPHYVRLELPEPEDAAVKPQIDEIIMPIENPLVLKSITAPELFRYDLFQTPSTGNPSRLIFQGLIANAENKKLLMVFLSKNTLTVRSTQKYKCLLSIELPYEVFPKKSVSNFWKGRLCVVMPISSRDSSCDL